MTANGRRGGVWNGAARHVGVCPGAAGTAQVMAGEARRGMSRQGGLRLGAAGPAGTVEVINGRVGHSGWEYDADQAREIWLAAASAAAEAVAA